MLVHCWLLKHIVVSISSQKEYIRTVHELLRFRTEKDTDREKDADCGLLRENGALVGGMVGWSPSASYAGGKQRLACVAAVALHHGATGSEWSWWCSGLVPWYEDVTVASRQGLHTSC